MAAATTLAAITAHLSAARCRKFLAGDGITSPDFVLLPLSGVLEGVSIDARAARKSLPALGETFNIAKNLDEYQSRICTLVPSLADKNPAKMQLQKYRIGIIAAFARLAPLVRAGGVAEWNRHARLLLEEASNAYVAASTPGQKQYAASMVEAFSFFGVPEEQVDAALARMYGSAGSHGQLSSFQDN
ncbi:hypothetical protein [Nitrososphaera viennensis]|uniref:Uncharacterized protein n=2 Tax=Nitrososphaera viennensis TaxID=1034015 RepID=A0A060HIP2_9ARCH|nr:hypothetical protein [Nitrososphaera viennensis]AIC15200.1 hypothetical protein NVIE_009720 [Nitrososphaera viennensis EN76]UVS70115.1 hypothetical protein NWT39_04835 [Nitrososphaera viennensis]